MTCMTYMAQPGRHQRSGRSLKTNEKSVENDLTNRLAHKNSDGPGALKKRSAFTSSLDRLTVCRNTGSSTKNRLEQQSSTHYRH